MPAQGSANRRAHIISRRGAHRSIAKLGHRPGRIARLAPSPLRGWEVPPPRPYTARIVARLKTIARLLLIAALCIVAGLAPRVHHRVVELTPRPQLRMRLGNLAAGVL